MNIFDKLKLKCYGLWTVTDKCKLTAEDISMISEIKVVEGDYGNSAKIITKDGCYYIPLSGGCPMGLGEEIAPKSVVLLTLSKPGEQDITRLDIE